MKIGIIGVGAIGGTIARKLANTGHDIKVANSRGKESVKDFAEEIGAIHSDLSEISQDIEILIISIPFDAFNTLPEGLFENLSEDTVIVDTGNYYPEIRDSKIEGFNNLFVKTEVKDSVHHTGHGCTSTGTNRYEKGILEVTELLAGYFFHLYDVLHDFSHNLIVDLTAVLIVLGAGFSRNGEALGNRETDVGHLCEVSSLTAKDLTHGCVTLGEEIAILVCHFLFPPKYKFF